MSHEFRELAYARKHWIPPNADGKPVNSSTVWRWIRRGLQGLDGERIRLEVRYCGNRPMVSREAIERFFDEVTEARRERTRRACEWSDDPSEEELAAVGLRGGLA